MTITTEELVGAREAANAILEELLKDKVLSAHIDRRTKHGGNGSDHDPAWVVLEI